MGHGKIDCFQIGKRVCQACILSPCLFNLHSEYITWNAGLDEAQAGIKIAWKNVNNLRYTDDTTLMEESEEKLEPLDESERGEWKIGLKLSIQKLRSWHLVPSLHANRWGNNENSERLYFLVGGGAPKSDGDYSHEIKKTPPPWKKSYDQSR